KSQEDDPSEKPKTEEWANIYKIMTSIHKVKNEYSAWVTEEDGLLNIGGSSFEMNHYWNLVKCMLPKWRARSNTRSQWLLALINRSRPPYVDNDLMGPVDIARNGNQDAIWAMWNDRYDFVHDPGATPQGHMARIKS